MNRMMSFVDEDVDVTNPAEVMGAMATRWGSKTQTDVRNCCWTLYLVPPSLQKNWRTVCHHEPHHHRYRAAVPLDGQVSEAE